TKGSERKRHSTSDRVRVKRSLVKSQCQLDFGGVIPKVFLPSFILGFNPLIPRLRYTCGRFARRYPHLLPFSLPIFQWCLLVCIGVLPPFKVVYSSASSEKRSIIFSSNSLWVGSFVVPLKTSGSVKAPASSLEESIIA